MPPLVSPDVIWVEPLSTWSHLCCTVWWHSTLPKLYCRCICTVWWHSTLPKLACWLLLKSHMFTGVVLWKGDNFCMTLRFATGQLTCCCCWMPMCFWVPTIGPHWVPVFCCRLTVPNAGVAWALGLWWWIETRAQMMVYICFIQEDQGMVPENSQLWHRFEQSS